MGPKKGLEGTKTVKVTLTKSQLKIIDDCTGPLGNSQSEIIRSIVVAWLSEKSILTNEIKSKNREREK